MLFKVLQPLADAGLNLIAHRVAAVAQEAVGLRLLHRLDGHAGEPAVDERAERARGALRVRQGARLVSARRHAARSREARAEGRSGRAGNRQDRAVRAGQAHRGARARARRCVGRGRRDQAGLEREPVRPVAARHRGGAGGAARRTCIPTAARSRCARSWRRGTASTREQILVGAGSNEIIDLLVQTFCAEGDEVLAPQYSFIAYKLAAEKHRRPFREAPTAPDARLRRRRAPRRDHAAHQVLFLREPEQPDRRLSGARRVRAARRRACRRACSSSPTRPTSSMRRARRLSRCAPVPRRGARAWRRCARSPRSTDWPGCASATRSRRPSSTTSSIAFACRSTWRRRRRRRRWRRSTTTRTSSARARATQAELPRLSAALRALGLEVFPSQTNFLLVGFGERDGRQLYEALLHKGVIVRPMNGYGLPHHLRITVGTRDGERAAGEGGRGSLVKLARGAALVGCGMVGGSLMAALRACGAVERVVGYDRDAANAAMAQAARARRRDRERRGGGDARRRAGRPGGAGARDRGGAAPIAGALGDAQLVTDVGSTKADVVAAASATLPDPARFCGAHPMAGNEKSGPRAAAAASSADLVDDAARQRRLRARRVAIEADHALDHARRAQRRASASRRSPRADAAPRARKAHKTSAQRRHAGAAFSCAVPTVMRRWCGRP